jgi:hypothetical protein
VDETNELVRKQGRHQRQAVDHQRHETLLSPSVNAAEPDHPPNNSVSYLVKPYLISPFVLVWGLYLTS